MPSTAESGVRAGAGRKWRDAGWVWLLFAVQPAWCVDAVSEKQAGLQGPIQSLKATPQGIEVAYPNGRVQHFRNVDSPRNGSPVTYRYIQFDADLQAYVIEVWRVGRQVVLVSKQTGAFVEVGAQRMVSPHKDVVFSSDCWEVACYYQLNAWPSGQRLVFSQHPGTSGVWSQQHLMEVVQPLRWEARGQRLQMNMACSAPGSSPYTAPAALVRHGHRWQLHPANPCAL